MSGVHATVAKVLVLIAATAAATWALTYFGAVYVGGESMAPALSQGDLVVVRRGAVDLRPGQIVWVDKARWPDGVLHRVQQIGIDGQLVLRGDANPVPDLRTTDPCDVRGVVVCYLPTRHLYRMVAEVGRVLQSGANSE